MYQQVVPRKGFPGVLTTAGILEMIRPKETGKVT
jgi:hypothetical protein